MANARWRSCPPFVGGGENEMSEVAASYQCRKARHLHRWWHLSLQWCPVLEVQWTVYTFRQAAHARGCDRWLFFRLSLLLPIPLRNTHNMFEARS